MFVVIAGDYSQAQLWAKKYAITSNRWKYADSVKTIRGLSDVLIVCVGTWYMRADCDDIIDAAEELIESGRARPAKTEMMLTMKRRDVKPMFRNCSNWQLRLVAAALLLVSPVLFPLVVLWHNRDHLGLMYRESLKALRGFDK